MPSVVYLPTSRARAKPAGQLRVEEITFPQLRALPVYFLHGEKD